MDCRCSDPLHATRSAQAGWSDAVLSTTTGAPVAVLCAACARVVATTTPVKTKSDLKLEELETRLAAAESKVTALEVKVPK